MLLFVGFVFCLCSSLDDDDDDNDNGRCAYFAQVMQASAATDRGMRSRVQHSSPDAVELAFGWSLVSYLCSNEALSAVAMAVKRIKPTADSSLRSRLSSGELPQRLFFAHQSLPPLCYTRAGVQRRTATVLATPARAKPLPLESLVAIRTAKLTCTFLYCLRVR